MTPEKGTTGTNKISMRHIDDDDVIITRSMYIGLEKGRTLQIHASNSSRNDDDGEKVMAFLVEEKVLLGVLWTSFSGKPLKNYFKSKKEQKCN